MRIGVGPDGCAQRRATHTRWPEGRGVVGVAQDHPAILRRVKGLPGVKGALISVALRDSRLEKRSGDMSDLYWLTDG